MAERTSTAASYPAGGLVTNLALLRYARLQLPQVLGWATTSVARLGLIKNFSSPLDYAGRGA